MIIETIAKLFGAMRVGLQQGILREVKVKEMDVERKIRLVYPARRVLSHAAQAFLQVVGGVGC